MSARSFVLHKRRQGNVTVERTDDRVQVILHKTPVVQWEFRAGVITLTSGGWQTVTTKTAINRALELLAPLTGVRGRIHQAKGQWYIDGQEFHDGMAFYPYSGWI